MQKNQELTFEQAASAGIAAITAYQGIVNNGNINENNIKEKRHILIIGASGGVGSYGVQIAKAINQENNVIGICSAKNLEYVKSLGADRVINYQDQESYKSFLDEKIPFDIILDCVGGEDYYKQLDPLLTKKGVYSTAVGPLEHGGSSRVGVTDVLCLVGNIARKKLFGAHRYAMIAGLPHKEFGTKVAPLFNDHAVRGTIEDDENIIPLKDISKAFEKIMSHRTVGKIVLSVN